MAAKRTARSYPLPPRRPLDDVTNRSNGQTRSPSQHPNQDIPPSSLLPHHHESARPNDHLRVVNRSPPAFENKRVSAVTQEDTESKRDSQISTSSTDVLGEGRPRKRHVGPWLLGKTLGKGSTGRVRQARHTLTGQIAAVKIVGKQTAIKRGSASVMQMETILASTSSTGDRKRLPFSVERETAIMKLIEHRSLVKFYDVWENRGELYIIQEFVEGGELFNYVFENRGLEETEAVRLFRQIMSGVAFCHEFQVCHRDIKPENILLDSNKNVKIVDFGMASFHHTELFDSSCGSPHYAAPELALGLKYRGEMVDIWACGVVLFVMLTCRLPFGMKYSSESQALLVLREIVDDQIDLQDDLSDEAEDLILRMLVQDPNARIEIDEIWKHPLLLKYDAYMHHADYADTWFGGPPPKLKTSDCGDQITRRQDIDLDLLRGLCTIWHSNDEEQMVEALLSSSPSYEKILYRKLEKFRNDYVENYVAPMLQLSGSDYHHMPGPALASRKSTTRASLLGPHNKRTRSQFSIASENVPRPSKQVRRAPSEATDQSYDPFRASRNQMTSASPEHATVTVLPGSRASSWVTQYSSIRHPAVTRLKQDLSSTPPSSPPVPVDVHGNVRGLRRLAPPRGYSRSSLASSMRSRGSSAGYRRSVSYKRHVSFNRSSRYSSAKRSPPPARPSAPTPLTLKQRYLNDRFSSTPSLSSPVQERSPSPHGYNSGAIRSRKEGKSQSLQDQATMAKNPNRLSANWEEKTRQVSVELSNLCDEHFNGDPLQPSLLERELSSSRLSMGNSLNGRNSSSVKAKSIESRPRNELYKQRPLPAPPVDELAATHTYRELAKTREKLLQRAKELNVGDLDDVIGHIERLMQLNAPKEFKEDTGRRTISSPEPGSSQLEPRSGPIKNRYSASTSLTGQRHVSEPTRAMAGYHVTNKGVGWGNENTTIRLVQDFDAMPPPLVIRKKSNATGPSHYSNAPPDCPMPTTAMARYEDITALAPIGPNEAYQTRIEVDGSRRSIGMGFLDTIEEVEDKENRDPKGPKRGSGDGKVKNWFRKSSSSQKSVTSDKGPPPPAKDDPPKHTLEPKGSGQLRSAAASDTTSDDIPFREPRKTKPSGTSRFLQMFSKKDLKLRKAREMALLHDDDSINTPSFSSREPYMSGAPNNDSTLSIPESKKTRFAELPAPRAIQAPPQNWFARFLQIKPAKQVLALQISRARAMKEIRGVLRDWKAYGMKDIVSDREAGRIWARVDENNTLNIKGVSIAVEIFTVMQKGRKVGLSVARFSQEKGAKSSFDKVVQGMKGVLGGRGHLVAEKKKAKEMRRCLARWQG